MSNTRFVNKAQLKADLATFNALSSYFENGGTIKVAKAVKRPKRGYTVSKVKVAKG